MVGPDLESLLAPVGVDEFLARHWECGPLLGRGDAGRYDALFGLDDLDALVAMARDKGDHRGSYCVRSDEGGTVEFPIGEHGRPRSPAAVHRAFDEGYTLVVNRLATVHPQVSQLCARVETTLQHPVGANLYVTPPGAQGFAPHHDHQDTFFLQMAGTKVWSLWEPDEPLPTRHSHARLAAPGRPPDQELELGRGDLLYLPRGWIHAGRTAEELSMHLTLNVNTTSWADLAVEAIRAQAQVDVRWRRSLPLATGSAARPDAVAAALRDLLADVAPAGCGDRTDPLEVVLARRLADHAPVVEAHMGVTVARDAIGLATVVERRDGLAPIVSVEPEGCRIRFVGSEVAGPHAAESALRFVARTRRFTVSELPDLPDGARCELVRMLVLHGLLRPASGVR